MPREINTIDYVEFPAGRLEDIAEAKEFYGAVFGWSFNAWGGDYLDTSSSGLGCGFNADPAHRPTKPLVVIYAADLVATRAKVIDAGGRITREIFPFPAGRRFHFEDRSGNELAVWSEL